MRSLWEKNLIGYRFLFDTQSSPGYEFGYFLNIVYNVYGATFFVVIDTVYVGMCLYCGCYLDYLKDHILEMDAVFKQ